MRQVRTEDYLQKQFLPAMRREDGREGGERMKKLYPVALLIISLIVAIGLSGRRDMWAFIVAYWVVLTAKNFCDMGA